MRTRLSKKEELPFNLWENLTPSVDWHGWGATAEDSNRVILEGLNGFFSHVALVFLGGN
jgi:hypothetical protein